MAKSKQLLQANRMTEQGRIDSAERRGRGGVARPGRGWIAGIVVVAVASLATACVPPRVGVAGSGGSGAGTGGGSRPAVQGPIDCEQPAGGTDFTRVDPEQVALRSSAVEAAIAYGTSRGAQSLRVYRHGCLVGSSGMDSSTDRTPLPAWSMTKGVVSLIVGRAVSLGFMGVDDPIGRHLPGLDAEHGAITVRQLLNQTSGLRFAWANDLNAAGTGDSAALVLARPFEAEPGTTFRYAQTAVTALVAVVEGAVGEDIQAFAARELFEPIGISAGQWRWQRDSVGRTQGYAFLEMSPRSFGRIGSLLAAQGTWRGRALIDSDYIAAGSVGSEANPGYGFLWMSNASERHLDTGPSSQWIEHRWMRSLPADAFAMTGMFNQQVVIVPSLDLVVVRMGLPADLFGDPLGDVHARRPGWDHRFYRMLLAGVTDVAVPDAGDWTPDPPLPVDPDQIIGVGF